MRKKPRRKWKRWPGAATGFRIGELGKLIEILKTEGITEIMMAGQVKHAQDLFLHPRRTGGSSSCSPPCRQEIPTR